MPKYELVLARTETRALYVTIEANSESDAKAQGHGMLSQEPLDFSKGDATYADDEVNSVERMDDKEEITDLKEISYGEDNISGAVTNKRELAAILAGLRMLERALNAGDGLPAGVPEIYTDGQTLEGLTEDEIDALCDRLNA